MNMKTSEFPARLITSIADSDEFQQALARLKHGKSSTPRSWVYEHVEDPVDILKMWEEVIHSNEDGDLSIIADWDLSKSDKFAAQGAVAPFEDRQHTLSEYWAHLDSPTRFLDPIWAKAKASVIRKLGFNRSGVPRPVDAVISKGLYDDKYNTNSGDPLCIKRWREPAIAQAKAACLDGTWTEFYPILGSRASMGKVGADARWIFMFPFCVNLKEQQFQQPLQEYIRSKSIPYFTPWEGWDAVQPVLSQSDSRWLKFGCDYSKMDQHFNFYHAEQCYDVIKHFFRPEYHEELFQSIHYTFHCPVIAPEYLILGPHAMPSGSGWTNFLETVFNFILVEYFKLKYGLNIKLGSMGIGDDQLWFLEFNGKIDKLTKLVVSVFKECGLDANPEKQEVSYSVASFLQRHAYEFWSPEGVKYAGVYPTVRALTSEIFPEFYHNEKTWTKNTFALRCLMILENCNYSPWFEEFCIFIANGNQNIVEFCLSDDAFILLTRHQSKKIANFLPTYTQSKIDEDPTKFESLRVIREHFRK
nr:MAG: putative RNA-dependent RNA polymerase [Picobirnavirus sp.]